ncbi:hypothetical protein, partial [Sphingomonas sp.]|uniref:hypothetical protein n=1 Tax=Sphingomonas sp. TaxID=28214 RepID=UPI0025E9247E
MFPETLVDVGGWGLRWVDTTLPGFALTERPDTFEMDVDGDQVVYGYADAFDRYNRVNLPSPWKKDEQI